MDQATRASTPSKTTSVHRVRHIVVEAKQRPLFPGHCLPDGILRRKPQFSFCLLSPLLPWPGLALKDLTDPKSSWKLPPHP